MSSKFGKYEVLEKIGVGGFGVVFRAFDPHIKRLVAIKTCTTDDEEVRTRFFQEAEIAGNLQHRNVVTVYDFGIQDDVPYLVQEYLSGEDLDKKIKAKADLAHAERVSYLLQVARGMEFAHSKGVVHRDIKPANIRILEDGTAKIMDFGIAKLAQRHTGLTQTGMTLGTAAYLAPEQIRGEPVDPRTDIFSFGAMAYELLTLKKAFEGETISTVLYQILHKDPPAVHEFWPDVPADLETIVANCLAKDAERRYSTTAQLVEALERLYQSLRVQKAPSLGLDVDTSSLPTTALKTTPGGPDAPARPAPSRSVAAAPAAAPPAPRAATTAGGGLDLAFRREGEAVPEATGTVQSRAAENSGSAGMKWAALVVGAVVLGGGGWWLATRTGAASPPAESSAVVDEAKAPSGTSPASAVRDAPAPAQDPAPEAEAANPEQEPAPGDEPPGNSGATAAAAVPPAAAPRPVPPPAPPEPRRPVRGTVSFAAAWDPRMTVTVDGGAARTLDRASTVELDPGAHELRFELITPEFRASRTVNVDVTAGSQTPVAIPLDRPGQVTIQPALGTPLGVVRLDGEELGQSPLRGRVVASGTRRLEVLPMQGGTPINAEITIKPGTLTTVTFDLGRGQVTNIHDRPLGSS